MSRRRWRVVVAVAMLLPAGARGQDRADSTANLGWRQVAIGAAALAAMITLDAPVARGVHGSVSPATLNTAHQLARFGEPTGIGPILGGVAIAGLLTHNRKVEQAALHAFESVVLASVVTQVAKHVTGRVRPYGDPDFDATDVNFLASDPAFPSGHTAAAFAMATSLGDAINNRWARVGLWGIAIGTGWARIVEEAHWSSDVLAGAAVGVISARFVSGRLRVFGVRAPQIIIGPQHLAVRWTF